MLSNLLTAKPLLIAVAVLSATTVGLGWYVANLHKQLGAAHAECEVTRLADTNNRNTIVQDLAAESLRAKVEALETELAHLRALSRVVALRHSESQLMLEEYRKQLNAARKANPDLDKPVDTSRLRALESNYRVRPPANRDGAVQGNPGSAPETALRDSATQ